MTYRCTAGCDCKSFREHIMGVSFSAHAMPNRNGRAVNIDNTEAQWSKDHAAYRRLVKQGIQPGVLDGCANLEANAVDRTEIERGKLVGAETLERKRVALDRLTEAIGA